MASLSALRESAEIQQSDNAEKYDAVLSKLSDKMVETFEKNGASIRSADDSLDYIQSDESLENVDYVAQKELIQEMIVANITRRMDESDNVEDIDIDELFDEITTKNE